MKELEITVTKREKKGKEFARASRKAGMVPAVLYGKGADSMSLMIEEKIARMLLHHDGSHSLINLTVENGVKPENFLTLIGDVQKDPFQKKLLHMDFHMVKLDEKVHVTVPITLQGEPAGVKQGGVLEQVLWEVDVKAFPRELPEAINVDISQLGLDEALHIKDLIVASGIEIDAEADELVVAIHSLKAEEETGEELLIGEPSRQEPEIVGKKGKEKEED